MTNRFIALTLTALLAASASVFANETIQNKSDFVEKVVGKKVADVKTGNWLLAKQDGKLEGRVKGFKVSGKWYWSGNYWCRTARIGIIPVPRECQQINVSGQTLILKRHEGTGSSHIYRIN